MRFKPFLYAAALGLSAVLCSCGRRSDAVSESDGADSLTVQTEDMDELENGGYYVCHNGVYTMLSGYRGNFTDGIPENTYTTSSRVLWFSEEELAQVITLYRGDSLVFYTDETFDEEYSFERFYDNGYTIGVSNLEETETGRYAVNATEEDNTCVDPESDAWKITQLGCEHAVIDAVGHQDLRSGNVADGGVITGLKKGAYYLVELYSGTELNTYTIEADTDAMVSGGIEKVSDYTFLRSKIAKINIPDYFNTGYYLVQGVGVVRYVDGSSYDENTDFNCVNSVTEDEEEESGKKTLVAEDKAMISVPFTIDTAGNTSITVSYVESDTLDFEISSPTVKVLCEDRIYTLSEIEKGTFSGEYDLEEGDYVLELIGLYGRKYEYRIVQEN